MIYTKNGEITIRANETAELLSDMAITMRNVRGILEKIGGKGFADDMLKRCLDLLKMSDEELESQWRNKRCF